ncbi:RIO1 family regulatory kinase/ATPase [Flammeovirga agarivorans]|uniref:Uncharacterized protein n=1 Tax=Flammeovirga agarivorans TaxID=2726742 RepID=A0A7X8SKN8_9BACT|nr:RIO1 family regulatory kinase/ATPase [Flammeovirga agarivorans]NLR92025.1 hypothetical protein [Flammeovirga agarivorans]
MKSYVLSFALAFCFQLTTVFGQSVAEDVSSYVNQLNQISTLTTVQKQEISTLRTKYEKDLLALGSADLDKKNQLLILFLQKRENVLEREQRVAINAKEITEKETEELKSILSLDNNQFNVIHTDFSNFNTLLMNAKQAYAINSQEYLEVSTMIADRKFETINANCTVQQQNHFKAHKDIYRKSISSFMTKYIYYNQDTKLVSR